MTMIETSSVHDPILLLHSSCTGSDEETASSEQEFAKKNETEGVFSVLKLLKQPILCDLLLLPEHPSPSFTEPDYLHLKENPLNPCGIANVLTLEKLPQHWLSGPILLSLSSCNIFHSKDEESDDKFTRQTPLIVEPVPSTFVLDFSSNQNIGGIADGRQGERELYDNSIVTVKSMSEIVVAFDVREASILANSLLRHQNATRINTTDDHGESRQEDWPKNHPDDEDKDVEAKRTQKDQFYSNHRLLMEDESNRLDIHGSSSSLDLQDRALMIAQLNIQLDKGTETIDTMLFASGFFCIVSAAVLLWVIYQYYKISLKSDMFSEEIRQCMAKTHDILQVAANELKQFTPPHCCSKIEDNEAEYEIENTLEISVGKYGLAGGQIEDLSMTVFDESNVPNHCESSSPIRTDVFSKELCLYSLKDCEDEINYDQFSSTHDDDPEQNSRNHTSTSSFVGQRIEENEDNEQLPTTPTLDDKFTDIRSSDISSEDTITKESKGGSKSFDRNDGKVETNMEFLSDTISVPAQRTDMPTSTQREGEKKLCFLKFFPSPHEHSFLTPFDSPPLVSTKGLSGGKVTGLEKNKEVEIPQSPCLSPTNDRNNRERQIPTEKKRTPAPLSPCSQLQKEWNDGKTVRRGNLKKKRQFITPIVQTPAELPLSSTNTEWKDDGGKNLFESTIVSRVPKTSKLYDRYYHQQDLSSTILPPPKLRSMIRTNTMEEKTTTSSSSNDKGAKYHETDNDRNVMKTPPFDMTLQKVPRLCSTPASEDDGFIDDYW